MAHNISNHIDNSSKSSYTCPRCNETVPANRRKAHDDKHDDDDKCHAEMVRTVDMQKRAIDTHYSPIEHRTHEKAIILHFLEKAIKNEGHERCLYITGTSGVGKPRTVREVIACLPHACTVVIFDAMSALDKHILYTQLLLSYIGVRNKSTSALQHLETLFTAQDSAAAAK